MIAPVEAPSSGYKYGKGIYLTDFIEKAMDYSDRNLNKYYILICEAALGNTLQLSEKKMFTSEKDIKAKGYDSIISDAYNHCSFEEVFYFRDVSGVFRKAIRPDKGMQERITSKINMRNMFSIKKILCVSNTLLRYKINIFYFL